MSFRLEKQYSLAVEAAFRNRIAMSMATYADDVFTEDQSGMTQAEADCCPGRTPIVIAKDDRKDALVATRPHYLHEILGENWVGHVRVFSKKGKKPLITRTFHLCRKECPEGFMPLTIIKDDGKRAIAIMLLSDFIDLLKRSLRAGC